MERRCRGCRGWYDKREKACPDCGTEPFPYNSWLRTAKMNGVLLEQKRRALQEQ